MYVYSGRRGVHIWVCDERARSLTDIGRKAIVGYMSVVKGGAQQGRKVNLGEGRNHPHIDVLRLPSSWKKVLDLLQSKEVAAELDSKWTLDNKKLGISEKLLKNQDAEYYESESVSEDRWDELTRAVEKEFKKKKEGRFITSQQLLNEIILQYVYPRLDENVSTHLNHLLKSPFCIHPKTGKVCVPIPPHEFDKFNPSKVPTIVKLLMEINQFDSNKRKLDQDMDADTKKSPEPVSDIDKTSLKKYIKAFEIFISRLPTVDNSFKNKLEF
ncbi:DNA primase small subunit [Smittium mucronatum]|uniref:DNA primase small subunit n=1 Tax=Smittium mucronatum TaxID=133383 RepID=A0A1R0H5A8_9FUNG|nr:DNA primase small subunit [Smittium mucronatum]